MKFFKGVDTSKRILRYLLVLISYVSVLAAVSLFLGYDQALIALITGVFSLASLAVGFYYWKAKNENLNKYAKKLDKETFDKLKTLIKEYEEAHGGNCG